MFPASSLNKRTTARVQEVRFEVPSPGGLLQYRLLIEHDASSTKARIKEEALAADGMLLFRFLAGEVQLYRDDHSEGPRYPFDWSRSALATIAPRPDNQRLAWFKNHLARMVFLRMCPMHVGAEADGEDRMLAMDGGNFASWFRFLSQDSQHEAFLRRTLSGLGHDRRKIRVSKSPGGKGAADAWVLQQVPAVLRVYRTRHVEHIAVVMMDADRSTLEERLQRLDEACRAQGMEPRAPDERVLVLLPRRNIETWLAYLAGEDADEAREYPKLEFASGCQPHVDTLLDGCKRGALREPVPPSLAHACGEYRTRLQRRS